MAGHKPETVQSTHLGRSFSGTQTEDICPCEKAACGLVNDSNIHPNCDQHSQTKTMRQRHAADSCPGESPVFDPTAYDLGGDRSITDPRIRRLNGWTNHGNFQLNMPFMTEVAENLWHGGVEPGLILPVFIDYKLSLYRWLDYTFERDLIESRTETMYDRIDQGFEQVHELAEWVNERRLLGPVFVHCQAGLNRSSLVVAAALVGAGDVSNGADAINLIRRKRDQACLCNPAFETWVRQLTS